MRRPPVWPRRRCVGLFRSLSVADVAATRLAVALPWRSTPFSSFFSAASQARFLHAAEYYGRAAADVVRCGETSASSTSSTRHSGDRRAHRSRAFDRRGGRRRARGGSPWRKPACCGEVSPLPEHAPCSYTVWCVAALHTARTAYCGRRKWELSSVKASAHASVAYLQRVLRSTPHQDAYVHHLTNKTRTTSFWKYC